MLVQGCKYKIIIYRSTEVSSALDKMKGFFESTRAKTEYMKIDWIRLLAALNKVWWFIWEDELANPVYRKVRLLFYTFFQIHIALFP